MNYNIKDQSGNVLGRLELAEGLSVEPEASGPPAPPQQVPQKTMTAAAAGYSREDFLQGGWTDEQLMAHGLMTIERVTVPAAQEQPAQLHPSVANTQLGPEWQPEPPPSPEPPPAPGGTGDATEAQAPTPPPAPEAPIATPGPFAAGGATPSTPEAPSAAPEPPPAPTAQPTEAPGVPTPPPAQAAPATAQQPEASTPEAGADEFQTANVPRIEGREFIVKGVNYEQVVDKRGIPWDGRVHGVSAEGKPALKKDNTWKKKRGIDADYHAQIEEQLKQAMQGAQQEPQGAQQEPQGATQAPAPPSPPQGNGQPAMQTSGSGKQQAPAAPTPPPAPQAPGAPDVAPEQPDNLAALESALSDWEEV